jgi:hypothetical protein
MKNIAILVACFVMGCSYGMEYPKDFDPIRSDKMMSEVRNHEGLDESTFVTEDVQAAASGSGCAGQEIKGLDRSINIDIANPDLIGQWQDISNAMSPEEAENNIFETSASAYKEGRFWTVVRKIFQPLQITTNASTMVLITSSEVVKNTHPSISTGLSYGALGSAMASGVLSLFITKMNSKINDLNRLYKAKLAEEGRYVNVQDI